MDNTPLLADISSEKEVFNRKYDAGHWNDTGALAGMSNILSKLSELYPDILLNSPEDFSSQEIINQYLPLSFLEINEPSTQYTRINSNIIDVTADDTDITIDPTYNDYSHFKNTAHPEYPRILVFRGSYFLGCERFFNESFSESIFVHSYHNVFNMNYYIDRFNPDIVLFESVEYATTSKYFPKDMLDNPLF